MSVFSRAVMGLAGAALLMAAAGPCPAYEQTLAGLRLGRPAITVLKKYGNPTRIRVGTVSLETPVETPTQPTSGGRMPGPGFNPYARQYGAELPSGMVNPYAPEYEPPSVPGPGYLPPLPGIGGPPGSPAPAAPGQQTATITQQEVTWTYDLPHGVTLEVIVAEGGLITQITVGGAEKWAPSKTSKGIQLGSTYKDVLYRYGYPEAHTQAGRFLRLSYVDKDRCMFTMLDKKVVGITIALAE